MRDSISAMPEQGEEPAGWESSPPTDAHTSGVPESFERFVDEHYQAAYRFAFSMTNNHSDACDLTQQSFYLAHTRSHQLRDPAKRKQWLFSILYREFLHGRRRATA